VGGCAGGWVGWATAVPAPAAHTLTSFCRGVLVMARRMRHTAAALAAYSSRKARAVQLLPLILTQCCITSHYITSVTPASAGILQMTGDARDAVSLRACRRMHLHGLHV